MDKNDVNEKLKMLRIEVCNHVEEGELRIAIAKSKSASCLFRNGRKNEYEKQCILFEKRRRKLNNEIRLNILSREEAYRLEDDLATKILDLINEMCAYYD